MGKTEIRKARNAELKEQRRKLFPIRLVDFDTICDWECFDADTGKDLGGPLPGWAGTGGTAETTSGSRSRASRCSRSVLCIKFAIY